MTWRCPECGDLADLRRLAAEYGIPSKRLYNELMQRTMTTYIGVLIASPIILVALGASFLSIEIVGAAATALFFFGIGLPIVIAVRRDPRHLSVSAMASVACLLILATLAGGCVVTVTLVELMATPVSGLWLLVLFPAFTLIGAWKLCRHLEAQCRRIVAQPALDDRAAAGAVDLRCPTCDYALRGMRGDHGTCPECGTAVEFAELVRRATRTEPPPGAALVRRIALATLLVSIVVAVSVVLLVVAETSGGRLFGALFLVGGAVVFVAALNRMRRESGASVALIVATVVTALAFYASIIATWYVLSQLPAWLDRVRWTTAALGVTTIVVTNTACGLAIRAVNARARRLDAEAADA